MAYREVYFRIQIYNYDYGYGRGSGWLSEADADAFQEESRRLFQELGWTLHAGGGGVVESADLPMLRRRLL